MFPTLNPEVYTATGELRTCLNMPDFESRWEEANKASYIRTKHLRERDRELSIQEIFDNPKSGSSQDEQQNSNGASQDNPKGGAVKSQSSRWPDLLFFFQRTRVLDKFVITFLSKTALGLSCLNNNNSISNNIISSTTTTSTILTLSSLSLTRNIRIFLTVYFTWLNFRCFAWYLHVILYIIFCIIWCYVNSSIISS